MRPPSQCPVRNLKQIHAEHAIRSVRPCKDFLVSLFAAFNSSLGFTQGLDLPRHLWDIVRFGGCGPLVGQTEEVNWLKEMSDGILFVGDYT
ncbi:MAG: hypothetical protein JW993_11730 [Sedimentisphaerales bacterium]|nr:hypothetical protein [Sedimentisphaerales bacterium]